ncbi:MAG TPA: glycine cleavage system aminomethyltransferase GcvT [Thermaerobacter sp.]
MSGNGGDTAELKRTPLYEEHLRLGARMVGFAGWEMPVQYAGIIEEHHAVRRAAGLFDVSHMGEIEVAGPRAREALQRLVTNDVERLVPGRALYTVMCTPDGGIVDDLLLYQLDEQRYMLVVNAANTATDLAWVEEHCAGPGVTIIDRSLETALIALQGPRAAAILRRVSDDVDVDALRPFHFVGGWEGMISRTGYTGEDGFELFLAWDAAVSVWRALLEAGAGEGLVPAGLGARDTLRFEACLPLYGHELDRDTTPLEAGLGFVVKWDKGPFIGREALERQRAGGVRKRLVGLRLLERGVARAGYPVVDEDGRTLGRVTSGTYAPTLDANLALAYVPPDRATVGQRLAVLVRGRPVAAEVVSTPFYRRDRRGG